MTNHHTDLQVKNNKLVVKSREWRCDCGRLLFKGEFLMGIIEAKCPRCKNIVYLQECNTFTTGRESFMVLIDPSGTIMSATSRIKSILGFEPEEVIGTSLEDCIDESSSLPVPFWIKKIFELGETEEPNVVSVLNILNKEGGYVPLAFFAKATGLKGRPLIFAVADAGEDALDRFSKKFCIDSGEGRDYQYSIWDFLVDKEGKILEVSKKNKLSAGDNTIGEDVFKLFGQKSEFMRQDLSDAVESGKSTVVVAKLMIGTEEKECDISLTTNIKSIVDKDKCIISISVN